MSDKRSQVTLTSALALYEGIFNESVVAIYVFDQNKRFVDTNQAGVELLGYSREELLKLSMKDVDVDPIAVLPAHKRLFANTKIKNYEHQLRRKDGNIITVLNNSRAITDASGKIIKIQSTLIDITEQKKTEAKLAEVQKMDSIGNLAGGIAHDFNNLLTVAMGYTEILTRKADEEWQKKYFEQIDIAHNAMKELTQNILNFSRKSHAEKRPVNLNKVVKQVCSLIKHSSKNVKVTTKLADDVDIDANEGQVRQVLMNLCINSIQAMQNTGNLLIETCLKHNQVCLKVKDDGCGMSADTLARIYEPYFTTKHHGEIKGSGLGMAVVYGIVKNHNGIINIDSVAGEKTVVEINFPRDTGLSAVEVKPVKTDISKVKNVPVLVVENEESVGEMLVEMLEIIGYKLLLAKTGKEAVTMFRKNKDKLKAVVLNYQLPDFDGDEVYRQMKGIADIPTMLSSGFAEGKAQHCLDMGVKLFLGKPYSMELLAQNLQAILSSEN